MKNPKLQAVLALALTFAAFWGLLAWDPFRHLRDVFVKPALEDAKVSFLFIDPNTQEVSSGEHPLESLQKLESGWCNVPKETRYILTGNSQTITVLLAPSEARPTQADRTYPDLLLDRGARLIQRVEPAGPFDRAHHGLRQGRRTLAAT